MGEVRLIDVESWERCLRRIYFLVMVLCRVVDQGNLWMFLQCLSAANKPNVISRLMDSAAILSCDD
jgi:hypothetical protein